MKKCFDRDNLGTMELILACLSHLELPKACDRICEAVTKKKPQRK